MTISLAQRQIANNHTKESVKQGEIANEQARQSFQQGRMVKIFTAITAFCVGVSALI
jgi:hypothetical protein